MSKYGKIVPKKKIKQLIKCLIVGQVLLKYLQHYPDDMSHKHYAREVLASLNFLYKDLKNKIGLFHSDLMIPTLSSYYSQIFGAVDVHDVGNSRYCCDEEHTGVIALSLAAVSHIVAHIHIDRKSTRLNSSHRR